MIDYVDLIIKAELLRNKLGVDGQSPIDIFALVQRIEKLTIVYYPMGQTISGICVKGTNNKSLIALNSSMSLGRQRFSLAHELYHLYYDKNNLSICAKAIGEGSENEKKADAFAAYFLMPRVALIEMIETFRDKNNGRIDIRDVIRIEQYFRVSHQAAVYQLYNAQYISKSEMNKLLEENVKEIAEKMGFNTDLYCALTKEKQYGTFGYYIERVNLLLQNKIISNGKYEELLLEAYRDDLVYGVNESGDLND